MSNAHNVLRTVHLVGSVPGEDAEEVIRSTLLRAELRVRSITDGETGARRDWIVHILDSFRQHPAFQLRRDGDWSGYDNTPVFRVRPGHRLTSDDLEIGQAIWFERSYPIFQQVRAELAQPGLSFQVGIPGDLNLALFAFGPTKAFQYRRLFREALLRDIHRIHTVAADDVIFQLEIPVELILVTKAPAPLRPAMAALLARGATRLVADAPAGARFGVHLCLGDLNHQALGQLRDAGPIVSLATAITSCWPAGRPLEFLHAPLAAGAAPASLDPATYAPLARLRLPAGTRFVAGFVHEAHTLDELRRVRSLIEDSYGQPVDVAAACGLGRRTPRQAIANIDLARQLCT